MSNILKDLIKRALKEADDAAMKKSALGMAMYGKKAKMKEAEITAGEGNTKFKLKVDVSNPQSETKLGVRLQLTPKEGLLEPDTKDTLEAAIMKKLNTSKFALTTRSAFWLMYEEDSDSICDIFDMVFDQLNVEQLDNINQMIDAEIFKKIHLMEKKNESSN